MVSKQFHTLSPGLNIGQGQSGGDFLSFCNRKQNSQASVPITCHLHQISGLHFTSGNEKYTLNLEGEWSKFLFNNSSFFQESNSIIRKLFSKPDFGYTLLLILNKTLLILQGWSFSLQELVFCGKVFLWPEIPFSYFAPSSQVSYQLLISVSLLEGAGLRPASGDSGGNWFNCHKPLRLSMWKLWRIKEKRAF